MNIARIGTCLHNLWHRKFCNNRFVCGFGGAQTFALCCRAVNIVWIIKNSLSQAEILYFACKVVGMLCGRPCCVPVWLCPSVKVKCKVLDKTEQSWLWFASFGQEVSFFENLKNLIVASDIIREEHTVFRLLKINCRVHTQGWLFS